MSYRRAKSLDKLVEQLNTLFPNRDKASDGWIGDSSHKSRNSDHNAWIKHIDPETGKEIRIVSAQDIDKDLSQNVKVNSIVTSLFDSRDDRIKYLIFNDLITTRENGRIKYWKNYKGTNAHREHFHISVKSDPDFYDDTSDWKLNLSPKTVIIQNTFVEPRELRYRTPMMNGADVKELQARLIVLGYLGKTEDDGVFGKNTNIAVRAFQRNNWLKSDGKVGPKTREKLANPNRGLEP